MKNLGKGKIIAIISGILSIIVMIIATIIIINSNKIQDWVLRFISLGEIS